MSAEPWLAVSPTMVRHLAAPPNEHGRRPRTVCGVAIKAGNPASGAAGWALRSLEGEAIDCLKCARRQPANT